MKFQTFYSNVCEDLSQDFLEKVWVKNKQQNLWDALNPIL